MVAVARAIVEPRELLIVDEPSKGLAPAIINNMIDAFAQLKASGVTILLVEQNILRQAPGRQRGRDGQRPRRARRPAWPIWPPTRALQRSLLGLAL
jgi:branched-chain amino acid transport system ATP-binding protein